MNVFPVSDSDTGTNVELTLSGIAEALPAQDQSTATTIRGPAPMDGQQLDALVSAAILSAHGNCGAQSWRKWSPAFAERFSMTIHSHTVDVPGIADRRAPEDGVRRREPRRCPTGCRHDSHSGRGRRRSRRIGSAIEHRCTGGRQRGAIGSPEPLWRVRPGSWRSSPVPESWTPVGRHSSC